MAKYKSLIVTTLLSVAALTGAVTTGVVRNRSMASSFEGDGYIVNVAETEEGLTAEPVYFSAGTKYKKTYPDEAVFKDIRGTKYTVDQDSFVHYQDGSMSAMTSGVVLNLDDVNGGLVNTYSFGAGTVLASNGTGFTAENNGTSIPFDNFVWKLSDDKYYVYSDDLKVETVNGMMEDGAVALANIFAGRQPYFLPKMASKSVMVPMPFYKRSSFIDIPFGMPYFKLFYF